MPEILTTRPMTPPTAPTSTEEATPRVAAVAAPVEARRTVYAKRSPLTAYQATAGESVKLFSGVKVYVHPGMWVVANGSQIVDVIPEELFKERFEAAATDSLIIPGEVRAALEQTLGFGSTESAQTLATVAGRLARLSVGDIAIDFSPGQWDVLKHRASKRGITTEALVRQIVDKLTQDIWEA